VAHGTPVESQDFAEDSRRHSRCWWESMTKQVCLGLVALALALAGCGGDTDSDGKGNASGGTSSGGTSSGGTSSGGTSSGGASSGGTSSGGTSSGGTSSGGTGGGTVCGGLAGLQCAADEFCNYDDCGIDDATGVCEKKPNGCDDDCPGVCGCDGKFYCNACSAHSAGVDDSTSVSCLPDGDAGVTKCGGSGNAPCASNEFCQFANGCGAPGAEGVCMEKPQACDADCPGVCGCDGKFYCNVCGANAAGTNASDSKACLGGDGGNGSPCPNGNECNAGLLCCYPCGVQGCENQCMPPGPGGNCPLFP
jgi:hypothetical protein